MIPQPIIQRSIEQVHSDASTRTSIAALGNDVREIGSRQGPYLAARIFGRYREPFAPTKGASKLLDAVIGGIASVQLLDGSFIGRDRARSAAGRELMNIAEAIAFAREMHGKRSFRLYRCTDLTRSTPWFATPTEARVAWRRRRNPLMDSANIGVASIIAVKRHTAGLEYVLDPVAPVLVNWEN